MAESGDVEKIKFEKPNIKGDRVNIIVLILMYILQGALSGLNTGALPIILQNRKVSYADQVRFLFVLFLVPVESAAPTPKSSQMSVYESGGLP